MLIQFKFVEKNLDEIKKLTADKQKQFEDSKQSNIVETFHLKNELYYKILILVFYHFFRISTKYE